MGAPTVGARAVGAHGASQPWGGVSAQATCSAACPHDGTCVCCCVHRRQRVPGHGCTAVAALGPCAVAHARWGHSSAPACACPGVCLCVPHAVPVPVAWAGWLCQGWSWQAGGPGGAAARSGGNWRGAQGWWWQRARCLHRLLQQNLPWGSRGATPDAARPGPRFRPRLAAPRGRLARGLGWRGAGGGGGAGIGRWGGSSSPEAMVRVLLGGTWCPSAALQRKEVKVLGWDEILGV